MGMRRETTENLMTWELSGVRCQAVLGGSSRLGRGAWRTYSEQQCGPLDSSSITEGLNWVVFHRTLSF